MGIVYSIAGVSGHRYLDHFCTRCNFYAISGCIVNDIIDMNFDKDVSRTKDRMLANKKVSLQEAVILMVGFLAVSASFFFL